MNEVLAGRELFSDAPVDDERWLRIIFDEAGFDPAFTIRKTYADGRARRFYRRSWATVVRLPGLSFFLGNAKHVASPLRLGFAYHLAFLEVEDRICGVSL